MSVMERHNYSNCPIKKRPFYAEKLEGKAGNDDAPVDLSSTGSNYKFAYSNNEALDFSTRRLTPSKEEEHNFKHEIYPISNRECSENSTNWYRREPNADQYYDRKIIHNDQHHRIHRNESSISPIVTNSLDFRQMYKNPYRNHNNNLIAGQGYYHNQPDHSGSEHMMMLSPASSQLSYGSNQSDFGESSEPEDLSVRNRKKVLVARDSSVNIQHPRNDYGEASSDLYYQCRSCSKCYSTYAGLVKHQQFHLAPSVHKSDEVEYKTITLSKSDLNARDKSGVENAKVVNPPRYQCKDCGKSYSTYSGLTKHQQFHCPAAEGNQVKKVFSCKNCDKVYVSLGALKMHIRTHTLPCKCPLCGKAFSRPWLLQGHIRTHTGEKPFSCQHCHRAFADRSNLRAHLQTHSEVKKYSCTSCTKTFSRMSLLVKHLQGGCPGSTSGSQSYGNGHNDHSVYDDASRAIEHNSDNGLIAYNANTGTRQDYSMDHLYQENVQVY